MVVPVGVGQLEYVESMADENGITAAIVLVGQHAQGRGFEQSTTKNRGRFYNFGSKGSVVVGGQTGCYFYFCF